MQFYLKSEDINFWLDEQSEEGEITPSSSVRKEPGVFSLLIERVNLFRLIFQLFTRTNELLSETECLIGELDEMFQQQVRNLAQL